MKKLFLLSIIFCLGLIDVFGQEIKPMVTLSGFIKEKGSLETLPGASVYIPELKKGAVTNNYGFYSLTVPAGTYQVEFSFIGFGKSIQKLELSKDISTDVVLVASNALQEVTVNGSKQNQRIAQTTQMSSVQIPIDQIKSIPALLGEKDVFKVLQLLPGVQKASEGTSGFHVRGGTPDQNLIILDDAVVYNANHLFGFFSIFNGDALKSVELFKGGFPARFGERLSSVTVVNMKDGNKEKLHGEAGIGLLSSRLTLEGPIQKGKSSFMVSGRRTYFDLLAQPFLPADKSMWAYFYDFNAKYNQIIDDKNRLYVSGYLGRDNFSFSQTTDEQTSSSNLGWGNTTMTIRWNHIFGKNLFSNTSLIYSKYDLDLGSSEKNTNESDWGMKYTSSIRDIGAKFDIDYNLASNHFIRAGLRSVVHQFKPQALAFSGIASVNSIEAENYTSLENNLFVEDDWRINDRLSFNLGLRGSTFSTNGAVYSNIEPRASGKLMLGPDLALKGSYVRMNQYLHLLSGSGVGSGISMLSELWVPSTAKVRPQQSDQFALGLAKDISEKNLTLSVEGYYKKMNNIIAYKEGVSFMLPEQDRVSGQLEYPLWEDMVTSGQGKSYGIEALLQRKVGKLSGWLGYTLSWTKYQFAELNLGQEFSPRQDRRHDFSLVSIYQPSPQTKLSMTWVYSSGSPMQVGRAQYAVSNISGPISPYSGGSYTDNTVIDYGRKGSFMSESYHRLDVGAQFIKKKKVGERIWEIGVYNLYGRANPFFYSEETRSTNYGYSSDRKLYRYSFLGFAMPSISYTRKF